MQKNHVYSTHSNSPIYVLDVEWVIRSELTLQKGCVIVTNESHLGALIGKNHVTLLQRQLNPLNPLQLEGEKLCIRKFVSAEPPVYTRFQDNVNAT